jgi:hypothetical protein
MGHKGEMTKVYLGKSKEELETYYEKVEPFVTVFSEIEKDSKITLLENKIIEITRRKNMDALTITGELLKRIQELENELKNRLSKH